MSDIEIKTLRKIGLVYVSDTEPGILRKRQGKGFCYRAPDGTLLRDADAIQRIKRLGLPPAYQNVWICAQDNGHLQATGYDVRGRKQYRYHSDWQSFRSVGKFHQLLEFAAALPKIRRRVERDLDAETDDLHAALAALVTLLDATHIRVGNRTYARENGTYGATTLLKRHIRFEDDRIELKFIAKGGKRVQRSLRHPRLQRILESIADLPGRELFSWKEKDGTRRSIDSGRLNAYLAEISGCEISAKTFRTWGGSLAAFGHAREVIEQGGRPTIRGMSTAAAAVLHNTPAICRSSYIHPVILDLADSAKSIGDLDYQLLAIAPVRGLRAEENRLFAYLQHTDRPGRAASKKKAPIAVEA